MSMEPTISGSGAQPAPIGAEERVDAQSMHMSEVERLAQLSQLDPGNLRALQKSNKRAGQGRSYVSSSAVATNDQPFNAEGYQMAMQAEVGMSEHINLIAPALQGGMDAINVRKAEFAAVAETLRRVTMPDTRVTIGTDSLINAFDVKLYANEFDQERYVDRMVMMLGEERMRQVLAYCTKSNQMNEPALWLNQHIDLEAQKKYVWQMKQSFGTLIEQTQLPSELEDAIADCLKELLGPRLFDRIHQIHMSQHMSHFCVVIVLVDEILGNHNNRSKPVTSRSIWDKISPKEERKQPEMTAAYARGLR